MRVAYIEAPETGTPEPCSPFASEDGTGVLLEIDEVQYLSTLELGALITAIHRTTQLNLPVVLAGAGLPQLPGLAGDAKSSVIAHLDRNFFQVRTDRLTPKEKEYLTAMARLGPGPHRSGDIAAELGVKVEWVAPRPSALISKGMIYSPAHGDTAFSVPMFDDFLLQHADRN